MRAVDLFAGWGGLTLGSQQAGVPVVWAANHWPLAVQTHQLNHPEAQHVCQDLRQADWTELPEYDLLLAAPACFAGDTTVVTARGVIPISDVVVGDLVLTHRGRWRPVTATMTRTKDTVHLGITETTVDHRYYSRRQVRRWHNPERRSVWYLDEPSWTPVEDLHGRFVAVPAAMSEDLPIPDYAADQSDAFWYLVGRWLGDGWTRDIPTSSAPRRARTLGSPDPRPCLGCGAATPRNKRHPHLYNAYCGKGCAGAAGKRLRTPGRAEVSICTGQADDTLGPAFAAAGLKPWHRTTRTSQVFTVWNAPLVQMLRGFGSGAAGKTIPGWVLCLPAVCRRALLNGYMDADGSPTRNGWKSTTVSRQLAVGVRLLASSLGFTANVSRTVCVPRRQVEERTVELQPYQYTVGVVDGVTDRYTRVIDGLRWMKQRKAPGPGRTSVRVFDLTVAEDHSFVADGFVVHNCQGHSTASQPRRRAYHDALRATAMAVIDCADITMPRACVIENVSAFTQWRLYDWWREGLERLGYQLDVRYVTASHFGVAQRRRRLFIIATRPGVRVHDLVPSLEEPPFEPLLETAVPDHLWTPVAKAPEGVRRRIERSAERHGRRFLTQHTTDHYGVPLHEPIRTITTAPNHWNLVDGDHYRALTGRELARGMGFPDTFTWPETATAAEVTKGLGNSVCPPVGRVVVEAVAHALAA